MIIINIELKNISWLKERTEGNLIKDRKTKVNEENLRNKLKGLLEKEVFKTHLYI